MAATERERRWALRSMRTVAAGAVVIGSLALATDAEARPVIGSPTWTRQVGTEKADELAAVATNRSGMVFAAGYTEGDLRGTSKGGTDAVAVRYETGGRRRWTVQFGGPYHDEATAVAATAAGDLYVAGYTYGDLYDTNADVSHEHSDMFVAKFDRNGRRRWIRQFGAIEDDYATAITVSQRGEVFIVGATEGALTSEPAGGSGDVWIAKYDRNGNLSWLRQFGNGAVESAEGVAVTSTGAVLVTGYTDGAIDGTTTNQGGRDVFIARFDRAGTWVSSAQWGSAANDVAYGIAAGPSGSAYVAGYTTGNLDGVAAGDWDGFVSRVDTDAATSNVSVAWSRQIGSPARDWLSGVAVTPSGNVYVAGTTAGSPVADSAGSGDLLVAKFDASGVRRWADQRGTAADDRALAVSAMSDGNVFVAGNTEGPLGGTPTGESDAVLLRYGRTPNQQWVTQTGSAGDDYFAAVALGKSGALWAAGSTNGTYGGAHVGSTDPVLARFDSKGNETTTIHFGTAQSDYLLDVAATGDGGAAVVGTTVGDIDGAHSGSSIGSNDAFVARYREDGTQAWIRQWGTSAFDSATTVAVDTNGNVYVLGVTAGTLAESLVGKYDVFLTKFDALGTQLWTHQFGSTENDFARSIAITPSGSVYIAGDTAGDLGGEAIDAGNGDGWLARYDRSGTQRWIRRFGTTTADAVGGIVANRAGEVFVAGVTAGDFGATNSAPGTGDAYLVKFDRNGARKWVRQFGTAAEETVYDVALGVSGSIILLGGTRGDLGGNGADTDGDGFAARFLSSGKRSAVRQFGSASYDEAVGVVTPSSGGVLVVGATVGTLGVSNVGGADAYVARLEW